jgi:hypothetical protein
MDIPLVRDPGTHFTHPTSLTPFHFLLTPFRFSLTTMRRSDRNRTTLTPGVVDLPKPRQTSTEVALEKKKKSDAATAKAEAMQLAAVRVAELERRTATTHGERLTRKQPRKQPAMSASRDVSFSDRRSDKPHSSHIPRHRQFPHLPHPLSPQQESHPIKVERRGRRTINQWPR